MLTHASSAPAAAQVLRPDLSDLVGGFVMVSTRKTARRWPLLMVVLAAMALLAPLPSVGAKGKQVQVTSIASGLRNPRGIDWHNRALYVAEAGKGRFRPVRRRRVRRGLPRAYRSHYPHPRRQPGADCGRASVDRFPRRHGCHWTSRRRNGRWKTLRHRGARGVISRSGDSSAPKREPLDAS
jgi:hypothetical protein